ncbi:MAG: hypothetical protein GY904_24010 [Planctomycetaceae bacterium]|nr:hypothetical protein [Planctomycetaceae bacterium]
MAGLLNLCGPLRPRPLACANDGWAWSYATGFGMAAGSFTVSILLAMLVQPPRRGHNEGVRQETPK